jgi:branched-chain amino acid transport system substrate-binding protein
MIKNSLISILILITLTVLIYIKYNPPQSCQSKTPIHVALVGPMSGKSSLIGKSLRRGADLYVNQINRAGGINGKCVQLDIYDDQNNRELAIQKASEIISNNKAIAVIGHWFSTCSFAAGMQYKKYKFPVITPGSTNVKVTRFNPWFYRLVFNDHLQGRFLANYAVHILNKSHLLIINEDNDYGNYLATVFEATGRKYHAEIAYMKGVSPNINLRNEFTRILKTIRKEIEKNKHEIVLFIAAHAGFASQLIYRIRKAGLNIPIIVPDSCASDAFWKGFQVYPKERQFPGYYSNGIYVTTHLLFDISNESSLSFFDAYLEHYGEPPDWIAAHAFDASMIIIENAKRHHISGIDLQSDRKKIQKGLSEINHIDNAIKGVTGLNCFDKNGDSLKPVAVGYYRNQKIIPAHVQFQAVPSLLSESESENNQQSLIQIDGQNYYKTCVVYTGIHIKEISNLLPGQGSCEITFDVWFRYHGNIDTSQMIFLNASEPISLGEPIESETNGHLEYRRYQVQGRFKTNFLTGHTLHRCQVVGFQFHHPTLKRNQLIFVPDRVGMDLKNRDSFINSLREHKVIASLHEWSLDKSSLFQSILKKESLGKLEYLNTTDHTVDYSLFNVGIRIQKSSMSIRGLITENNAEQWMIICAVLILISLIFKNQFTQQASMFQLFPVIYSSISMCISIIFLLSAESFLMNHLIESINAYYLDAISKMFDSLWWIVPAFYLNSFIKYLVWQPIEHSTRQKIPNIIRRFVSFMILTLTILGILAFVFDQKITSLLATSGVIAMIIGLAIQINISNIFSGIAINLERPFSIGDWVKVGEYNEGKVLDITWRTTRLMTRDDCILSIPNSVASESVIHNYHYPDQFFRLWFDVYLDSRYDTEKIRDILFSAVSSSNIVEKTPEPLARFMGLTDWAAKYLVSFTVKNYGNKVTALEKVWTQVLSHLHQAGISPAVRQWNVVADDRQIE